jgi:outer membrane protein assembly factor BamB
MTKGQGRPPPGELGNSETDSTLAEFPEGTTGMCKQFFLWMTVWGLIVGGVVLADDPGPVDAQAVENAPPRRIPPPRLPLFFPRIGRADIGPAEQVEGSERDFIDARAPRHPELDALWRSAQQAVDSGDWKRGIEALQKLLDFPEDALVPTDRERWQSLRAAAQSRLHLAPAAVRADYERQYGGLAQQLLSEARRSGSRQLMVEVATRFLHTRAGADAANQLATQHLDRREFTLAWRWFRELEASHATFVSDPRWRLKAALAARVADPEAVPKWLERLGATPVEIGGRLMDPQQAWRMLSDRLPLGEPWQHDWPQPFGGATRLGRVPGGEPLLQPEWIAPWLTHPAVQRRIGELLADLQDDQAASVWGVQPIAVGDKVAFRDLRGVRVVSAKTGETLWETVSGLSPEHILVGQLPQASRAPHLWRMQGLDMPGGEQTAEFHPLTNLLFRDGLFGGISTDDRQLYVLEELAVLTRSQPGYPWGNQNEADDAYGAAWDVNRLTAYDLETGRLRWSLGGKSATDVPGTSLAGAFFLGVPLAVGSELYVVAARGEEIRLEVLDAVSGRPLWSQLLAYADSKVEVDLARRWMGAPVAFSQGVVVCPTTVGWLVAVDSVRRSLLWAYRYLPRVDGAAVAPGPQLLPQRSLNDQWMVGAPGIVGQAVLFAPPDTDQLLCVDLCDGRLRWKHPRGEGVYVGGESAGKVLVVEQSGLTALSLENGARLWRYAWDDALRPSGRGVVSGDRFILPLGGRELLSIDAASGTDVRRWRLPSAHPALGNLIKAHGQWISLSPEGCAAYGERDVVTGLLAEQLARNPADPVSRLRAAEIDLLDGKLDSAEQHLRHLSEPLPADLQPRRRNLLWELWSQKLQAAPAAADSVLEELSRAARNPEEQFQVHVWRAESWEARGQSQRAFDSLWSAAFRLPVDTLSRPDAPQVRVRAATFVSGWLGDVWTRADDATRRHIDTTIAQAVAAVTPSTPSSDTSDAQDLARRGMFLAELCAFHPAAAPLWWRFAEERSRAGDFAGAETILARLVEHRDTSVAAESRYRLARLWQDWGLDADLRQLTHSGPSAAEALPSAWSSLIDQLPADALEGARPGRPSASRWEARQSPTMHAPPTQELVAPEGWPSWQRFAMQVELHDQRVTFRQRASDRWHWLAPLRSLTQVDDAPYVPTRIVDHRMWVLSRDVLHLLSPFERKVAWTRSLNDLPGSPGLRPAQRSIPGPLLNPANPFEASDTWQNWLRQKGRLAAANRRYLCLVGRRELAVLDPLTGEEVWRKKGVAPAAQVFGSPQLVYVYNPQRQPPEAAAYRADDGRPVPIPHLARRLQQALCLDGEDFLLLERPPSLFGLGLLPGKATLRRWNPLTDTEVWKLELSSRVRIGLAGERRLLVVHPSTSRQSDAPRSLEWIALSDGSRHALTAANLGPADNFTPLVDGYRLYLVANSPTGQGYHYGDSLPTIPVNGRVAAWDLRTGELLWQRDVAAQHLVLDRLQQSPALIFLSRSWKQQGNASYTQLALLAIHKDSGEVLYEKTSPSAFSGFHGVSVRGWEPTVELQAYNLRLRLGPSAVGR